MGSLDQDQSFFAKIIQKFKFKRSKLDSVELTSSESLDSTKEDINFKMDQVEESPAYVKSLKKTYEKHKHVIKQVDSVEGSDQQIDFEQDHSFLYQNNEEPAKTAEKSTSEAASMSTSSDYQENSSTQFLYEDDSETSAEIIQENTVPDTVIKEKSVLAAFDDEVKATIVKKKVFKKAHYKRKSAQSNIFSLD